MATVLYPESSTSGRSGVYAVAIRRRHEAGRTWVTLSHLDMVSISVPPASPHHANERLRVPIFAYWPLSRALSPRVRIRNYPQLAIKYSLGDSTTDNTNIPSVPFPGSHETLSFSSEELSWQVFTARRVSNTADNRYAPAPK